MTKSPSDIVESDRKVEYVRMAVIKSALYLLSQGIKPNKAYTMAKCLAFASSVTGVLYGRSRQGCKLAYEDLRVHMKQLVPN